MVREKDKNPCKNYPITIHYIKEDDDPGYFFAYHPDFGASTCSATGDTIISAIISLARTREDVIEWLTSRGEAIPQPTQHPFSDNASEHAAKSPDKICTQNCAFAHVYRPTRIICSDSTTKNEGDPCHRPIEQFDRERAEQKPNKNKLDNATKFYLRRIVQESKKIQTRHTLDMVDELVAKALRLRDTVDPTNRKYYGVIDSTNYAVRIGALALRLLTRNFLRKAIKK
jgi:predicted RNase H-like HicB family nuclease